MNRRDFIRLIGVSAAAAAVPAVLVPERRIWQVPANAPVGRRIERVHVGGGYLVTFADGDSMVVPYDKLAGVRTPSGAPVVAYEVYEGTPLGRQLRDAVGRIDAQLVQRIREHQPTLDGERVSHISAIDLDAKRSFVPGEMSASAFRRKAYQMATAEKIANVQHAFAQALDTAVWGKGRWGV